jgi:predicted ATPase
MLTQIELENFKCFKERTSFPLGQLTLLTGINGCGKSTLLQSLLLMRQSIDHNENTDQILLNGSCVSLNSFNDVRNINNSRNESIKFKYYINYIHNLYLGNNPFNLQGNVEYCLNENSDDDMVAKIVEISFLGRIELEKEYKDILANASSYYDIHAIYQFQHIFSLDLKFFKHKIVSLDDKNVEKIQEGQSIMLHNLTPSNGGIYGNTDSIIADKSPIWIHFGSKESGCTSDLLSQSLNFNHIHYISADRLGPQEFYLKSTINKFPNVGAKGEFTVNLLYKKRDDLVNEKLCLGEDAKTLATQTEEWLNEIFNGAKVEVPSSESNILELLFNTSTSKDRFRPANVGFGYSYILPIVVSGLIAKEGEILIVENPEAHLHPKAQSRLAKFLAKVSSCGVQVFIESHSDHILNALRIAVLDDIITHEDLSILYFQQNPEQPVVQIPVQPNGGIEEWPEGFFDQMDKDFARLFGM